MLYYPLKVLRTNGISIGIGGRVAEIDGNGHPTAYGKFHCVEVVAQALAQPQGVVLDGIEQLLASLTLGFHGGLVALMGRVAWLVGHDEHVLAAQAVATEVVIKLNSFLVKHDQLAGFIVGAPGFFGVIYFIYAFPAAAGVGLHEGREANALKCLFPIEHRQVAERVFVGIVGACFAG